MASGSDRATRLIYDPKVRGVFFQIVVVGLLVAGILWIIQNTVANLARQDKGSGFDFLWDTAGFEVLVSLGTWVVGYTVGVSTYLDVFWLGVINTLIVAFLGIIAATIIGFLMGIFRLSSNIVLRGTATAYIEALRNLPLLLQLFFWYFFVLRALPTARERIGIFGDSFGLNITGLYTPLAIPQDGFMWTGIALVVGVVATFLVVRWAHRRQDETGQQTPVLWIGLGLVVGLPVAVFLLTGAPIEMQYPEFRDDGPILRRGFQAGQGMVIKPEMMAVWLALSLYTASFIAEIVRAGILAVPHGQTEAAGALGLRYSSTLNLVVIPQAMRVIIPPLTSQYLNLTKNSSLAVAIAYPDVVSIFAGTALNQVGREIEMIFMMMMVYLIISILTSGLMNWFNAKMKLVER